MTETFELRRNERVRRILCNGAATPAQVSEEEQINPSQCFHCGALLPTDADFQAYHMEKVHGLVV